MNHRYEALLVLNAQGKDDTVREIIDRLESEFQKEGAQIDQVQKMKFKLDPEVYRQNYQRLPEKKEKPAKRLAKAK